MASLALGIPRMGSLMPRGREAGQADQGMGMGSCSLGLPSEAHHGARLLAGSGSSPRPAEPGFRETGRQHLPREYGNHLEPQELMLSGVCVCVNWQIISIPIVQWVTAYKIPLKPFSSVSFRTA